MPAARSDASLGDIDLTDLDVFATRMPHDWFDVLRRDAPVWRHPETEDEEAFWMVSSYARITEAVSSGRRQSFRFQWVKVYIRAAISSPDLRRNMALGLFKSAAGWHGLRLGGTVCGTPQAVGFPEQAAAGPRAIVHCKPC